MPRKDDSSVMPPPPPPATEPPGRSDRVRAQKTSAFQAVVVDDSALHSPSPQSSLKRKPSDGALSRSTSAKRSSKTSSVGTAFSAAARNAIIRLNGEKCWHCGSRHDVQFAHVIAKSKKAVLWHLQQVGRVGLKTLHDKENGMRMCVLCHASFDDPEMPAWVFVPSNLDYFINFENTDFRRRQREHQTTGNFPIRHCPPAKDYVEEAGGLYDTYMLRQRRDDNGWNPGLSTYLPRPKWWHGDPMTALYKGFKAIGINSRLLPSKLAVISDLYQRNDEGPREQATGNSAHNGDGSESHGPGRQGGHEPPGPSTPKPTPNKTTAAGRSAAARQTGTQDHGPSAGAYGNPQKRRHDQEEGDIEPKRIKVKMAPWVWGPHKSSSDHAEYHEVKRKAMEKYTRSRDEAEERAQHARTHLPSPELSDKASKNVQYEWCGSRRVLKWLSETSEADGEVDWE
ncbi:MAG: hypothetical protein Q9188_005901 [Gyalolechia gomerana]